MESFEGGGGRGGGGGQGESRKRIRSMEGGGGRGGGEQSLGNLGNDERLIFHGEVR